MAKTSKKTKAKTNILRLQRMKTVDVELLSNALGGKRISAQKRKFGIELISYDRGGFSIDEKIIIAETLGCRYNGKEVI